MRGRTAALTHKEIQFGDQHYPFHYGIDCTDQIVERILDVDADMYVLVVDTAVTELHARPLVHELAKKAKVITIPVTPSERNKSIEAVAEILEIAFSQGMTRRSCVLAMGGGVVGNMAGLAAALAFRGIRLIHLPTTIIAALDSVLSFKQAVNGRLGKNLIGTFHQPTSVLVDLTWLTTLPLREMRSGLCELVKNSLAIMPDSVPVLSRVLRRDCRLSAVELASVVDIAIDAKVLVMKNDAREKNGGLALEYGHTIGHALELAGPGILSHGEAVGVGMLCAGEIAERAYELSAADLETHHRLLGQIGVTQKLAEKIDGDTVLRLLRFDNKRGYLSGLDHDQIPMILLDGIGSMRWNGKTPLCPVPVAEVEKTLRAFTSAQAPRPERVLSVA